MNLNRNDKRNDFKEEKDEQREQREKRELRTAKKKIFSSERG